MPSKKGKRKKKRFRRRYILLILVLTYIIYSFGSEYFTLKKLNAQYAALEMEKQQLLSEQQYLQAQHKYMLSDAFVELIARKELGFVKPGEHVILSAKPGAVPVLNKNISPDEIH